jgi:CRISPR-associated exonuclease Cas4
MLRDAPLRLFSMIIPGLLLVLIAVVLFILANRQRRAAGMPAGRVIYSDTGQWNKVEKPLYDAILGLTGKPDYLVAQSGYSIPVEVKSSWAPSAPLEGHLYQLATYCLLVERLTGKRPPYGILHYRNRTFAIDYTQELETHLLELLGEIRQQERRGEAERSHAEPARCARCGYRNICDQVLH